MQMLKHYKPALDPRAFIFKIYHGNEMLNLGHFKKNNNKFLKTFLLRIINSL